MVKKFKRVVASVMFFTLLIGCGKFFQYILVDDTTGNPSLSRLTFHEMYSQDAIDILFVGSSHAYRSFAPSIFDEKWNANTFNAGTSAQNMDGSYMIIKEAVRYNDIKHIYLDLYYVLAFGNNNKDRTDLTSTYLVSDYLHLSFDKLLYLLQASSKEHYINNFIVARRHWEKLFDEEYVRGILLKKCSEQYKNYDFSAVPGYIGKGYYIADYSVENWNYFTYGPRVNLNVQNVAADWVRSLEDIIAFCRKNKIELTLVSTPMPDYRLIMDGDYDVYVDFICDLIKNADVDYYDFNLCREEYFPCTSSLFMDHDHLNRSGSELFSNLLADLVNGDISKDELFYDSYEEKLAAMDPTVFGVSYCESENEGGESIWECKIISTTEPDLEYKIVLSPTEGEAYLIQDFSTNRFFTIAPDEHGTMTISYRLSYAPDTIWDVNITY